MPDLRNIKSYEGFQTKQTSVNPLVASRAKRPNLQAALVEGATARHPQAPKVETARTKRSLNSRGA